MNDEIDGSNERDSQEKNNVSSDVAKQLNSLSKEDFDKVLNLLNKKSEELISLSEAEMAISLSSMDVSKLDEDSINIELVYSWYIRAEKIIRVLANTFSFPLHQSINQLRYAGHHILKYNISDNKENNAELVEAFKHCKRSVYDALDAYMYKLAEVYRIILPYLTESRAIKIEHLVYKHLREVQKARNDADSRIEYYDAVNQKLLDGLGLIEELNQIQRDSGFTDQIYREKKELIMGAYKATRKSEQAKARLEQFKLENQRLQLDAEKQARKKSNGISIVIGVASFAITVAIFTAEIVGRKYIESAHSLAIPNSISITVPDIKVEKSLSADNKSTVDEKK